MRNRSRLLATIGVVIGLLGSTLALRASDRFADVPDENQHHDNINLIADAGITLGCGGGRGWPARSTETRSRERGEVSSSVANGSMPVP